MYVLFLLDHGINQRPNGYEPVGTCRSLELAGDLLLDFSTANGPFAGIIQTFG